MSATAPETQQREAAVLAKTTVRAGNIFGRYQILVPIAAGGMGTVWIARQLAHPQFRRFVAVKISHDSLTLDEDFRKMFLDEARLASSIQHPNVCSVVDMGEEEGRLYLVMEWMASSLREVLRKVPNYALHPAIAVRVIADACAGLHAAHELCDEGGKSLELIHRDISPDNILFSADGRTKVTDFGIAKARDQLHKRTETGEVKGKLTYMAPEQITSRTYDRRVDVFSLGCVLYQAALGVRAFDGASATVMYDILGSRFARPHEVRADFPVDLEEVILRAMAHKADDRYATADAMRIALEELLTKWNQTTTNADVAGVIKEAVGPLLAERSERLNTVLSEVSMSSASTKLPVLKPLSPDVAVTVEEKPEEVEATETALVDASALRVETAKTPFTAGSASEPAPRSRSLWLPIAAAAVVLGLGASAAVALRHGPAPVQTAQASAEPTPPPSPVAPQPAVPDKTTPTPTTNAAPAAPITLSVRATPGSATLSIDDQPPIALPFRKDFPADGAQHRLRVDAPGYHSDARVVTFDVSRDLTIALRRGGATSAATPTPHAVQAEPPPQPEPGPTASAQAVTPGTPAVTTKKKKPIDRDLSGD